MCYKDVHLIWKVNMNVESQTKWMVLRKILFVPEAEL